MTTNRVRDNLMITLTHRKYETEIFHYGGAALTLAACSNDENMEMTEGPVAARITAGLSAPTTRAIGTNWSGTEEIGVFVTNSTNGMDDLYKNVKYQITNSGATGN